MSSGDRAFGWSNVKLTPGRNTVAVSATINGSTYTDMVEWTLA
ncbi:hypothetical protein [Streptomyces sp. HUAS ZL42]